jgi:hypothetical protein
MVESYQLAGVHASLSVAPALMACIYELLADILGEKKKHTGGSAGALLLAFAQNVSPGLPAGACHISFVSVSVCRTPIMLVLKYLSR